ncbi:hypothetical protein L288_00665 [Sphingobium quisquiliarum P25]|uniref:Uncharacterized protein n=1 Tax=Sphingobium quisquiliarum P25 TaxID=1329909 RepID=T0HNU2_9SPHN|nr:hypothetical protein L288_00665 [Sphingobium quisquiliarum P25]EZP74479.1 hypothetical protein BV96_00569 [Sphingomonas paucimobilis]
MHGAPQTFDLPRVRGMKRRNPGLVAREKLSPLIAEAHMITA